MRYPIRWPIGKNDKSYKGRPEYPDIVSLNVIFQIEAISIDNCLLKKKIRRKPGKRHHSRPPIWNRGHDECFDPKRL